MRRREKTDGRRGTKYGRRGTFEDDLKRMHLGWKVPVTCSAEMSGGQEDDFLKKVALWSTRSSGLLRCLGVTGAALWATSYDLASLSQCFRQMEWENRSTH